MRKHFRAKIRLADDYYAGETVSAGVEGRETLKRVRSVGSLSSAISHDLATWTRERTASSRDAREASGSPSRVGNFLIAFPPASFMTPCGESTYRARRRRSAL